ncbi:MAG: NTP transferase domain-containing protein [Betaproteobacteria bacterium]|nr:NTP transferase domain-containing protein [Betaproteobacteria bacterium]MBV9360524.1 NTP transferase domain-containing protein [Betaproteobacteria bacterium]
MKIVALVLAGGEGTRLYPLTAEHAKPALPFANGYRICDFVLSNLVNSKISTIYLLAQYKPHSLMAHIEKAWSPWFQESEGTIKVLLPRSNTLAGQFKGTADAVYQYLDLLQAHDPDLVAVFAADHIYRMDVRQMIDFHRSREAGVTVSALAVPLDKARGFGVISASAEGRVRDFHEKPKQPPAIPGNPRLAYASMGNYLFDPRVLERALVEARQRGEVDFGRDVLPRICKSERVYAYDFAANRVPGVQDFEERTYWRDVGTLSALAAAQQDAMGARPRFNLWNSRWPIRGEHEAVMLAKVRNWEAEVVEEEAVKPASAWRASRKDLHTDERVQPS